MRRLFVFIAALLTPAVAAPASTAPADAGERYLACAAQRHPQQVQALMSATSGDVAQRNYGTLANDDRCLSRAVGDQQFTPEQMSLGMDTMRGKLAELALLANEKAADALQPLPLQQKRYLRPWFAATGRHPAVDEMAACMADTDPAQIMALIRTRAGTADENEAVSAMGPALTNCLSAGTRLDASRPALRAALADALYQRLTNSAGPAAARQERGE